MSKNTKTFGKMNLRIAHRATRVYKTKLEELMEIEKDLGILRDKLIKNIPVGSSVNGVLHFQEDRITLDFSTAKALGLERKLTRLEQDTRACHVFEDEMIANEDPNAKKLFGHKKFDKLMVRQS